MEDDYDYILKVIVIGNSGVGKSSLVVRLIDDFFDENQSSTIGVEFGSKLLRVGEVPVKLQLWDTAGQETF